MAELASRLRLSGPPGRANPGPGGFLALAAVAVLVALVVGGWVLSAQPHRIQVAAAVGSSVTGAAASPTRSAAAAAPSPAGGGPVVDVVGKVRRPGVYRLGSGARVQDAVTAAGGMMPGVDPVSVNLARKLTDGEQLVIGLPAVGQLAPGQPTVGDAPPAGGAAGAGPLDLNSATVEQLDALPGVGPVLAQRIVDWRSQHGRFDSVADLSKVSGIGQAKLADLTPLVTVS
jgi:competence protein ComEA